MTKPLALLICDKLVLSSQLVNRLQDADYRVQTVSDAGTLTSTAEREKPLLIIVDAESDKRVCGAISALRAHPPTTHIPVIAFTATTQSRFQAAAREAGANLVVTDTALVAHLKQLLDQALLVE